MLPAQQSAGGQQTCAAGSTILVASVVGIKRDIRASAIVVSPTGAPEDGRIENVGAIGGCPLEPGVRLTAGGGAFSDHEADVVRAA